MNEELKKVLIYTDGACTGNPCPGGYGVILVYNNRQKELSGGFRLTTNNRMELMAAIVGLQSLKTKCAVTLYTDSQYLSDAIMKGWAKRWQANNWRRNSKEKALNSDLWEQLLCLLSKHEVKFEWIRGHAGNEENERCDIISVQAAQGKNLPPDSVYEKSQNNKLTSKQTLFN